MRIFCIAALVLLSSLAAAEDPTPADIRLAEYFRQHTERIRDACLADVETLEQWKSRRDRHRRELLEMLGLDPLPPKTDLKAVVTGVTEHEQFVVERLHFQSRPGLYVTGNLYRPHKVDEPLPAILYVCGHARVNVDGVSYGNKAHYQHHGAWFARNGYVCLTIDTLQLGEIEGIHHGTYKYGRWWWLNRGYTPAGVEAWNCVRALDYLQTRREVDAGRIGVTGRSGGGAYSWWIAAIDDRIKAAVPVAGITDLENYVVDGCVEGHCDCMFMFNTYQWDYPLVAALVAPRPLLISNTDRDRIFPLEGVVRTHRLARKIYQLHKADENLALHITAGPHSDTQELRVHAFRWFNKHLKQDDSLLREPAEKLLEPPQLKVFDKLPADQTNGTIDEEFVAAPTFEPPKDASQWKQQSKRWRRQLRDKTFRGWPDQPASSAKLIGSRIGTFKKDDPEILLRRFELQSQPHVRLPLWVVHRKGLESPKLVVLNVLDQQGWDKMKDTLDLMLGDAAANADEDQRIKEQREKNAEQERQMLSNQPWAMAYLAPRGIGPDAWSGDERKWTQIRRRFYLLGQSLDGMRVWDVLRATKELRKVEGLNGAPVWLQAERRMSGVALHAALFEKYGRVDLYDLPSSYQDGPFLLNARRFLDLPQTVALAADNSPLVLYKVDKQDWKYVFDTGKALNWDKHFRVR